MRNGLIISAALLLTACGGGYAGNSIGPTQQAPTAYSIARNALASHMNLPAGTRIYQSDGLVVKLGNHLYIVGHGTATRTADGSVVMRDSAGNLLRTLPSDATISVGGTIIQAIVPGAKLPKQFENATPTEVVK